MDPKDGQLTPFMSKVLGHIKANHVGPENSGNPREIGESIISGSGKTPTRSSVDKHVFAMSDLASMGHIKETGFSATGQAGEYYVDK